MKLTEELKTAIKSLPEKEKDKLLLRLIPKNSLLVQQLEYKLLENSETMLSRREDVKDLILEEMDRYPETYFCPPYMVLHLRELSGVINLHVNITKDKIGEIELNLLMLIEILKRNQSELKTADWYSIIKFDDYVVIRAIKLLILSNTIDQDYYVDFQAGFHELGKIMETLPTTMDKAKTLGLEVKKLINF